MGLLVDGHWQDQWYDTTSTGGRFVRQDSAFRNWVTPDGSPGPSGVGGFKAEPGRYHLYVSLACPWAHRTLIFRKLKGLTDMIDFSVVHWLMLENGWTFMDGPGVIPDPLYGARFLYEIYTRAEPRYTGRVTVPVLWDKATKTIVNNEFLRNHPDVQLGLRCLWRDGRRLLSRGTPSGNRRPEYTHLQKGE